jgi:hypothetical protein
MAADHARFNPRTRFVHAAAVRDRPKEAAIRVFHDEASIFHNAKIQNAAMQDFFS